MSWLLETSRFQRIGYMHYIRQSPAQEMQAINLKRAEFHGEWNHTIASNQRPP
jgi:hypothetical protein